MCPDRELISAFFDDETNERWSSELKEHIENCTECSVNYKKVKELSISLRSINVPGENEIRSRVYSAVERRRAVFNTEPFWKRHVEISYPALMGAAAVVAVLCAAMLIGLTRFSGQQQYIVEEIKEEPLPINVQLISIEDAAAYLLSDDSGFDVLITIPSAKGLSVSGEPQLIREADYKRSQ